MLDWKLAFSTWMDFMLFKKDKIYFEGENRNGNQLLKRLMTPAKSNEYQIENWVQRTKALETQEMCLSSQIF